jgi:hypothetical protein
MLKFCMTMVVDGFGCIWSLTYTCYTDVLILRDSIRTDKERQQTPWWSCSTILEWRILPTGAITRNMHRRMHGIAYTYITVHLHHVENSYDRGCQWFCLHILWPWVLMVLAAVDLFSYMYFQLTKWFSPKFGRCQQITHVWACIIIYVVDSVSK